MPSTRHSVMGAFTGVFYTTPSGRRLYLAHRTARKIHRRTRAWYIEQSVLDKCREQGIVAVGVIWKEKGARRVHLTHIDDFYGEHSLFLFDGVKLRGLPLTRFRIDPAKSEKVIASAIKLR